MTALVLDHLWQSTVLALCLGLLALAFRRASAGVRYGLWLSASVKFLIPFVALAALGRLIGPAIPLPAQATPEAVFIEQAAQPFSQPTSLSQFPLEPGSNHAGPQWHAPILQTQAPAEAPLAHVDATAIPAAPHLDLGWILLTVWALGSAAVLLDWTVRWTRLRKMLRSARRLDWTAPMPVLAAPSLVEPGLLGMWRPVLLVPETLPERLSQPEIDALVAHEACHMRRRDNLAAALHMLVEALFWFHPLVWWIGARLIDERERACDEAVVRAGHDRVAYARSLVEICRLYLQSPLDCVAGASGSNLKRRVEAIMTASATSPLTGAKKALLLAAGAFAFATPVAAGLLTSEGRKAAAPLARAVAAIAAPAQASVAPPDEATAPEPPAQALILARNKTLVAPALPVAAIAGPSEPLAQDVAAPLADALTPASDSAPPAPASTAPSALPQGDPKQQASDFVEAYAAATPQRRLIARWTNPICVQVTGLAADQAAAVRSRIEQVARATRVGVQPSGCQRPNVEIGFSETPQTVLDNIIAHNARILGDGTSGTRDVKTVSRPVQAWYETNGVEFQDHGLSGQNQGLYGQDAPRQFLNALVIVDLRRTDDLKLSPIVDEAAMLALAQPRSLDHCNALPSVTDLFAGPCSGRAAPTGLTAADTAYLAALYGPARQGVGVMSFNNVRVADQSTVASDMARLLPAAMAETAQPTRSAEIAQPENPSLRDPAPTASPLFQLASYSSADLSRQARDFVLANARVGQFGYTVRWREPLCLQVFGLTPEQNDAVKSRINAVAQTLAQKIYSSRSQSCPQKNVTILFATDPQRTLDHMIAHDPRFLGDARSDTRGIKTVTRPVQAWRETVCILAVCRPEPFPQLPVSATVLVDARRVDGAKLGAIADYVAMLVLADPRNLDHCQPLPSVLDLFAGSCPGRSAPTGLTRGDLAFLKALYTAGSPITQRDWNWSQHGGSVDQIAGRMGMLLAGSGSLIIPGAKPVLR